VYKQPSPSSARVPISAPATPLSSTRVASSTHARGTHSAPEERSGARAVPGGVSQSERAQLLNDRFGRVVIVRPEQQIQQRCEVIGLRIMRHLIPAAQPDRSVGRFIDHRSGCSQQPPLRGIAGPGVAIDPGRRPMVTPLRDRSVQLRQRPRPDLSRTTNSREQSS